MIMKTRKSFLDGVPSFASALVSGFAAVILLMVSAHLLDLIPFLSDNASELIAYILYNVLVALASYVICWNNPKSIWYVPLLCAIACILSAILESSFWITPLGIVLGAVILLSVFWGIPGARKGKTEINLVLRMNNWRNMLF